MSLHHYYNEFELTDGRTLRVEYSIHYIPATYWEPSESDVSEPRVFLDGKEVTCEQLPKGLDEKVTQLYENEDGTEFTPDHR